ncbi:hypothetical protein [Roseobacter sp.]|uniref:hypothetical protein n=1 Tax=Roseobacter sp. TaxID=1907202 RepID=UPI0025F38BE1|nr:hypothetical protein [Roseobacter sp.]
MFIRSALIGLTMALTATTAFAGPSGQHSAQASDHAAAAASHGSAAVASGVATVVAVPVIAVGSTLAVTGSALEELGASTIDAGSDIIGSTHAAPQTEPCYVQGYGARPAGLHTPCVAAGPAPTLD